MTAPELFFDAKPFDGFSHYQGSAARTHFPEHTHDELQVTLLLGSSTASVATWDEAGRRREAFAGPGTLTILPSQIPHEAEWRTDGEVVSLYIAADFLSPGHWRDLTTPVLAPAVGVQDPFLQAMLIELGTLLPTDCSNEKVLVDRIMETIGARLASRYALPGSGWAQTDDCDHQRSAQVRRAVDYIEANFRDDIGVAEVAAAAMLSRWHLSRAFAAQLGMSPYQYILRRRVKEAILLLTRTDMPTLEAGFAAGFGSAKSFGNSVKQWTGLTPASLRSQPRQTRNELVRRLQGQLPLA